MSSLHYRKPNGLYPSCVCMPLGAKVVCICSSFWLSAPESPGLSQAEEKVAVCEVEQIQKITTMFTQNHIDIDAMLKITPIYSRSLERKIFKHLCFCLVLGLLKSRISKKSMELFLRKLDFKLNFFSA